MAMYCTGTKHDKHDIIRFINGVFHENFYDIMKKTYAKGQHYEQFHHLVKEEDGHIVAALGIYEQEYHSKNDEIEPLKTGFIGSVSVDEKERGKGYMKLLMDKAEEQMREHDIAFAMLGGLRNRYGHWGYEYGGIYYQCHFREENIRHTIGWKEDSGIIIQPVKIESENQLDRIYHLYRENNNLWCRSREDFYLCSITWNHKLYEIIVDGEFAGYFVCNRDGGFIPEIELVTWEKESVLRIIRALMRFRPERLEEYSNTIHGLTIQVHAWEPEKTIILQQICEHCIVYTRCNMKILDYPKTLKFMLQHKQSYTKTLLTDGRFTISVKEKGTFVIEVREGIVSVWEDNCVKEIDLIVTEKECISALFTATSNLYEHRSAKGFPKGWFPLEFTPGNLDEF